MAPPGSSPELDAPPARKKTIVVLSSVVVVVALLAAAGVIYLRGGESTPGAPPREVGSGVATEDGDLSLSVGKLLWNRRVGSATDGLTAQGRFLLVHVMVLNIGEEPVTFRASAQKLFAGGREYVPVAKAAKYLPAEKVINPGDSMIIIVPFDLPRDTEPESLELHSEPGSRGVKVTLD